MVVFSFSFSSVRFSFPSYTISVINGFSRTIDRRTSVSDGLPDQRADHHEKSGESFTTSRHLNIIRQFCKHGLVTAVVFDMVCTSRQAGWYEGDSCFPVSREIVWDGPPYWYHGIGILAGDHSLPQWIPMALCTSDGNFCVAGVV